MKRIKYLVALCLMLAMSLFIPSAFAATSEAVNIVTNPGENMATEMNISYQTASNVSGTYVEYTLAADTDWSEAIKVYPETSAFAPAPSTTYGKKTITSTGFPSMIHCNVELSGLTPATDYMYRVGANTMSPIHYFETAEGDDSDFTFLALSDPQYGSAAQASVYNATIQTALTLNNDIRFALLAGDVVDRGGRYEQWKWLFQQSSTTQMPYIVTPGNHEYYDGGSTPVTYDATYFNGYYNNPDNGAEGVKNTSYYFMYNNVLFFSIDSEAAAGDSKLAKAEQEWFKHVMETHTARYVIVTMHRSFYGYIYGSASVAVRGLWQDIFDAYGVDFVYTGHDHIYSRTGYVYEQKLQTSDKEGTIYVTGGAAGQKSYSASSATPATVAYNAQYMAIDPFVKTEMLSMVTVTNDCIKVNAIDHQGHTIDSYTISKKERPTATEGFSKEDFEAGTTLTSDGDDLSSIVLKLGDNFLGHVNSAILSINNRTLGDIYLRKESQGRQTFTGFRLNCVWPYTLKISYKDGTTSTLEGIYATKPAYGSISNVAIEEDELTASLTWQAELLNDQITQYEIDLNDEMPIFVDPSETSYTFKELNPAHANTIIFNAIDAGGRVRYKKTIAYGEEKRVAHISAYADADILSVGEETNLYATPTQTGTILYKSSNERIITVSPSGVVTAVGSGEATVSIWLARRSDTMIEYPFTVNEAAPIEITLNITTSTLEEGKTLTLTSSVPSVVWSSSDEAVATVSSEGVVTAVSAGTATITATLDEATATAVITVTSKPTKPAKKGCLKGGSIIIPATLLALSTMIALAARRKKEENND